MLERITSIDLIRPVNVIQQMLKRYRVNKNGKRVTSAMIYNRAEHGIRNELVDRDAIKIIEKLKRSNFDAYIVGGAVRDLLIGITPKDFDIATSAYPKQIRKLFWNSRIIGKRFKLAHVYFQDKIIEVSTFRSKDQGELGEHNVYGTIEEDAARRDFTINALYYDPVESKLFDFMNALHDIREKRITSIIPLQTTFVEDPVRMIRCIKYATSTQFRIPFRLRRAIRRHAGELQRCSTSRMTEELFKILLSGHSAPILRSMHEYGLLTYMLPIIAESVPRRGRNPVSDALFASLEAYDAEIRDTGSQVISDITAEQVTQHPEEIAKKSRAIAALAGPLITFPDEYENTHALFKDIFKLIKQLIAPLTPPNYEVEKTVAILFRNEGHKVPKNAVRKPNPPHHTKQKNYRRNTLRRKKGHPRRNESRKQSAST